VDYGFHQCLAANGIIIHTIILPVSASNSKSRQKKIKTKKGKNTIQYKIQVGGVAQW